MGACRKLRELNGIVGGLMMLMLLGLGFIGHRLPGDETPYFATLRVNLVKSAPFMDSALFLAVAGGGSIGAATLSCVWAGHVLFLPAALLGLMGLHFLMTRHTGTTGPCERGLARPAEAREARNGGRLACCTPR